ncbi:MAG: hypothetical protein QM737_02445 [Ferruginibacter sp.]
MLPAGKKRVIVFMIYADFRIGPGDDLEELFAIDRFSMNGEMKIELDLLLKEVMSTAVNPQNARLFVIFNGIRYNLDKAEPRVESKTILTEIVNTNNSSLNQFGCFEIINHVFSPWGDFGSDNLQVTNKLTPILEKIPVANDEEVVLVTWDHGCALGIFRAETIDVLNIQPAKLVRNELDNFPFLKEFWENQNEVKCDPGDLSVTPEKILVPVIHSLNKTYVLPDNDDKEYFKEMLFNGEKNCYLKIQKNEDKTPTLIFNLPKYQSERKPSLPAFSEEMIARTIELVEIVPEILSNDEMASSVNRWLKKKSQEDKKIGILLMMNCWMMNLHTMYSFRETVECLVAPAGDIAIPGYNYRDILRYIYKPKTYFRSNQQVAKKMVRTTENKFALKRAENIYSMLRKSHKKVDEWKIIAVDLTVKDLDDNSLFQNQIDSLKLLIEKMNFYVSHNSASEIKWMFKYVRSLCYDFSSQQCYMIDILNWALSVKHADEVFAGGAAKLFPDIKVAVANLRNLILRRKKEPTLILQMSKGENVYPVNKNPLFPVGMIVLPPTGYNLFFPVKDFSNELKLKSNIENDLFLKNFLNNWVVFLQTSIDKKIDFYSTTS